MKYILTLIVFITLATPSYSHTDSFYTYKYGQVKVSINTGNYNRVQEDVKLFGQLLNETCKVLNITDSIFIDFIHSGSYDQDRTRIMFSKTEPFPYNVFYTDDNFDVSLYYRPDSIHQFVRNINHTVRIVGSYLDIGKALEKTTLYLYHKNKFKNKDYYDAFIDRTMYKSVIDNPYPISGFLDREKNKIISEAIKKILSLKHWLHYPEAEQNSNIHVGYYYQNNMYHIVDRRSNMVLHSTDKLYSLSTVPISYDTYTHLFIFTTPLDFKVIEFDYDFFLSDTEQETYIFSKTDHHICELQESDLGHNGSWNIEWMYSGVFLLDHSLRLLKSEGPFVLYDNDKKEIVLTSKK